MQLSELLLNRQLYRTAQETSTQDSAYMSANSYQSSAYGNVSTGSGEAAYAVNSNTPTVSGTKIRAGYIDSENYEYVSGNFTVAGMRIDLNNGAIYSKNFAILSNGDAYFTGNISATTGSIGGWIIGSSTLTSTNGIVVFDSTGTVIIKDANNTSNKLVTLDGQGVNFFGQGIYANTRVANVYSDTASGDGLVLSTLIGNINLSAGTGGGDITIFMQDYGYLGPSTTNKLYTLGTYGGYGWTELYFKPLAGNPTAPDFANGSMYYNGATEEMRFYTTGGGWKTIATGSVSLTLSALTIDTTKNWQGYGIFNMSSLVISPGGSITLDGVNRSTWPSSGTTTLSGLTIDTNKNWGSWGITQVGTITQDTSATFQTNWILAIGSLPQIGTAGSRFNAIYGGAVHYTSLVNDSDRTLKEEITPIAYGLDTISSLVPVRYKYIASPEYHLGFIAQDVQGVIPEIVSADEETNLLGLSATEVIPILVKAIQELKQEVELLKATH